MRPSIFSVTTLRVSRPLLAARSLLADQRRLLRNDVIAVKGLMPLLMRGRNAHGWTRDDRDRLRACLKRLSVASPYVVVLIMPGGFLLLPFLAWWLDRRSRRNARAVERTAP